MYLELGLQPSALTVAEQYVSLLQTGNDPSRRFVFLIDNTDEQLAGAIREQGGEVLVTGTVMKTSADRRQLAQTLLDTISTPERRQRGV
jgi:hypothetical protein